MLLPDGVLFMFSINIEWMNPFQILSPCRYSRSDFRARETGAQLTTAILALAEKCGRVTEAGGPMRAVVFPFRGEAWNEASRVRGFSKGQRNRQRKNGW